MLLQPNVALRSCKASTSRVARTRGINGRLGRLPARVAQTQSEVASADAGPAAAAAAPPPAAAQPAAGTSSSAAGLDGFSWTSYWYPVHVLESIDPTRPHAIELLGRQLVLWRDGGGRWQCFEDACPHRLAPLSEGRVEADGSLLCSYHGWRFDSAGKCTDIPQALDAKAKATACASSRSCATAFPVREAHGLIWVWPSAGSAAAAAASAAPLPISKGVVAAEAEGQRLRWYRRELPYSWDVLIENLTDPSHLPFSHHNLMPSMKRSNGIAMPFTPVRVPDGAGPEDAAARPAYAFEHRAPLATFEFPSALSPAGYVCFLPPSAVVYEYTLHHLGAVVMQNDLLAVPAGPGRSLVFTLGTGSAPPVTNGDILRTLLTAPLRLPPLLLRAHLQRRPTYQAHLLANKLFDQDSVFLNMQDRQIALRGKDNWAREYYCPTPCDGLVIAARKWATEALRLPVVAAGGSSSNGGSSNGAGGSSTNGGATAAQLFSLSAEAAAATRPLSAAQVNDRLAQHTKHCIVCKQAVAGLQHKLRLAQAAAAAMAAALLGLVAACVLPALVQQAAAAAGAGAGAAAAAAAGPVAAWGPLAAVGALLAAGAAAAAAVARSTQRLLQEFTYVEFSHATND